MYKWFLQNQKETEEQQNVEIVKMKGERCQKQIADYI